MTESCVDSEQEEESVMERNQETVRNVLNYIHEVENQRGTI